MFRYRFSSKFFFFKIQVIISIAYTFDADERNYLNGQVYELVRSIFFLSSLILLDKIDEKRFRINQNSYI